MPRLALLTAYGGPIELAEFPLSAELNSLQHTGFPFASADARLVPRGALIP